MGEISSVDDRKILDALDKGRMPILSSTATDQTGQCYNINADSAAAEVAIALVPEGWYIYPMYPGF